MNLSNRLKKIIDLLDTPIRVCDIGTDHAYIPIYLARFSQCSVIIASDSNQAPYEAALQNVEVAGVTEAVEVRLGSGLSVLTLGEVDAVIIAGMGGETIKDILAANYEVAQSLEQLVLQPMAGAASLRKWLVANEFKIADESLVKNNKQQNLYQILSVVPGSMAVEDQFCLELGPKLIAKRDKLLDEYFLYLEQNWQKIIDEISLHAPQHPKIKKLEHKIVKLQEVKEWL